MGLGDSWRASRRCHNVARGAKGPQKILSKDQAGRKLATEFIRTSVPVIFFGAADDDDKGSIFGEFINHTLMPGQDNQDQWSRHNAFISDKFIFPDPVICFDFPSSGQLPIHLPLFCQICKLTILSKKLCETICCFLKCPLFVG